MCVCVCVYKRGLANKSRAEISIEGLLGPQDNADLRPTEQEPWQEAHNMAMAEKHRPSQGVRYIRVAKKDLASGILAGDCV